MPSAIRRLRSACFSAFSFRRCSALALATASSTRRRSAEELLEWNRRQAEVVAGFAERHARVTVPSRRAGSAALDRKPYYVPADEPPEGSAPFDAYAGPKAAEIAAAEEALLAACAATARGTQSTPEARAEIEGLIDELASLDPESTINTGSSPKLTGKWDLMFTTESEVGSLGARTPR